MTKEEQRRSALEIANAVRSHRAGIRRELRACVYREGCRRAADLIESDDEQVQAIPIDYLLVSIRCFKEAKVRRLSAKTGIRPMRLTRKIGDLTVRERRLIAGTLRERAGQSRGADREAVAA